MLVEMLNGNEFSIIHLNINRLDASNVNEIEKMVNKALNKTTYIVIDLGDMNFMDSSGLGMLLNCYREVKAAGNVMRVVAHSIVGLSLLNLVYFEKIVDVFT